MAYKDKTDQAAAAKRHYEANKDKVKARASAHNKISRKRNTDYIKEIKQKTPCIDCGFSDWRALDFDHISGTKVDNVTQMALNSCSIEKIRAEIDKCVVRCANCHRIKTRETLWNN